jgi:hypothetical protein
MLLVVKTFLRAVKKIAPTFVTLGPVDLDSRKLSTAVLAAGFWSNEKGREPIDVKLALTAPVEVMAIFLALLCS